MHKKYNQYTFVREIRRTSIGDVNLVRNLERQYFSLHNIIIPSQQYGVINKKIELYKVLNHPHIQKTIEVFLFEETNKTSKELVVITQYLDNNTLDQKIGKLNSLEIGLALLDICSAVSYLHNKLNIVHRNLRPKNILIKNSRMIISDFCQAQLLIKDKKTEGLIGKKLYMSPQMLLSQKYDFKQDIWSLGIIFIELLIGKPFLALMEIIPGLHPQFPDNILHLIQNHSLKNLLKQMLEKNSEKRISISQVQNGVKQNLIKHTVYKIEYGHYIKIKQLNNSDVLVKEETIGDVYSLKKLSIAQSCRFDEIKNKLLKIQHEFITKIYEIKLIPLNKQVIIFMDYYQNGSLYDNISLLQDMEIFQFIREIWQSYKYLRNQFKLFTKELLNLKNIMINAGKIKIVPFIQNTFSNTLISSDDKESVLCLMRIFLQIALKSIIQQEILNNLIYNNLLQINIEYKEIEELLLYMIETMKESSMNLNKIDQFIKLNIYSKIDDIQQVIYKDYKLQKEISRGAFGNVYLCKNQNNQIFALKKIKLNKNQNKDQIIQEGRISVKLNHQNIVKAIEYFIDKKHSEFIIIMECCEEYTLRQIIEKLSEEQKKNVLIELCQGLRYLHVEQNLIHRDIKPTNILIKNKKIKLADMGRAHYLYQNQKMKAQVGSKYYMSPEMLNNQSYDMKTDIWSLGIVFLEVILGKKLNKGGIIGMDPQFPDNVLVEVKNQYLKQHLKKMLQRKPEYRYNINQVQAFLKNII